MQIFCETVLLFLASVISLSSSQSSFQKCFYFSTPLRLEATTTPKEIKIPSSANGANYRPNQNCKWYITAENDEDVVKLTITFYQLQGKDIRQTCVSDYVNIFDVKDGDSVFKSRFCGRMESDELSFLSSESEMKIEFVSDNQFQYQGFRAIYESQQKEESINTPMGVVLGVVNAAVVLLVIFGIVVVAYRIRKRKESERNRGAIRSQAEARGGSVLSPRATSPPTYSTDLSPFMTMESFPAVEPRQDVVSSPDANIRPSTPPPSYEEIDSTTPVESNDAPPPSYDTVLRESSHIDSPAVDNSFV